MKITVIILAVIPGLSQLYRGRLILGAILFLLFLFVLNGASVTLLFFPDAPSAVFPELFYLVGAAVWLFSAGETLRRTVFWDEEGFQRKRESVFREGISFYLQGLFGEADEAFRACLRLSPRDPDVLLYLAMVKRRQGNVAAARRYLRKCRSWDRDGKWKHEIGEEKERISLICQNDSNS